MSGVRRDVHAREMVLEPRTHTYRLVHRPELEFTSCTEFLDGFFEPFRAVEVASQLVATVPRYRGRTVDSLLDEWQQAADEGSRVHAEIERSIESGVPAPSMRAAQGLGWLHRALPPARFEYWPERIVYSERLRLAGTVDLIARDRETGGCVLVDWKTNKKITREPYAGKRGVRGPARDLDDCHLVRYGLQLSLYHYILESEYGIDPTRQWLVHLNGQGVEPIACDYARRTVVELLQFEPRS